jgi:possible S-adenosylhomocysteine deaminase
MLFGTNGRFVTTTVGNGKVLMKDREVLCVDEEKVLARSREGAARLAKKING